MQSADAFAEALGSAFSGDRVRSVAAEIWRENAGLNPFGKEHNMAKKPDENDDATEETEWQLVPSPSRLVSYILLGLAGVSMLLGMFFGLAFIARADTNEEYKTLHSVIRLSLLFWEVSVALFLAATLSLVKSWLGRVIWVIVAAFVGFNIYVVFMVRLKDSH